MTNFLRYHVPDLPQFDSSEVAWHSDDIQNIAQTSSGERFVRIIRVHDFGVLSLKKCLKLADETFERIAVDCKGEVIDHTFGLVKVPPDASPFSGHAPLRRNLEAIAGNVVPFGYALVADTAIVRDQQPLSRPHIDQIDHTLRLHRRSRRKIKWADGSRRQFMVGTTADDPEEKLRLVDIDVILRRE